MKVMIKFFLKRTVLFVIGVIICLILYLFGIRIYVNLSDDPIIFVASIVLAVLLPAVVYSVGYKFWKKAFDGYHIFLMYVSTVMLTVFLAVFGPVFIDRSISYHIAFYAAEQGEVNINEIRDEFSVEIFDKRIHDAQAVGAIEMKDDENFVPTAKAKFIWWFLGGMGKWSNTLGTYEEMKEKVQE